MDEILSKVSNKVNQNDSLEERERGIYHQYNKNEEALKELNVAIQKVCLQEKQLYNKVREMNKQQLLESAQDIRREILEGKQTADSLYEKMKILNEEKHSLTVMLLQIKVESSVQ